MKQQAFFIFTGLFVLGAVFGTWTHRTAAQNLAMPPYGGMVSIMTQCSCSQGFLIVVGPPVMARVVVYYFPAPAVGAPGVYEFRAFHPGVWVLGLRTQGATCLTGEPPVCPDQSPDGYNVMVGTSV